MLNNNIQKRVHDMDYIDEIVTEMLNGTFSVFCGAGADFDATRQEWQDIFSEKTKDFFYNKYSTDIYFLADLEKRYYNSEAFFSDICKNLCAVSDLESIHINNIVNLNINQIWTTNFDSIIEKTIQKKLGISPTIIKESADLFTENLSARYIVYKLNGCVTKPDTMILTKSDFFDYFKKQRLMFEMLKRQLVLDSFLFVGYSFADDLVLNALREIKEVFPSKGKIHYRFVRNQDEPSKQEYRKLETQYYYDKYNIKTIYIENFSDIDVYLQELRDKFCNHNVLISGSFRQLKTNDERIYIERLIDCLVQKLTRNDFNIYSGNGRGLGEIVVAQINKHNAEKQFVNRPLIFTNDSAEEKAIKNRLIMKDCDTMIIVCGQDDTLITSHNVINQFNSFINQIDEKKYPLIIPIPSTGYAAREIFWSDSFRSNNAYLTNKPIFDELERTTDVDYIAQLVVNLIKSYKTEKV